MFDILITVHEKDFNKVKFLIGSIKKNIIGFDKIFIVSNVIFPFEMRFSNINYLIDDEVINYDFSMLNNQSRVGWYKQQFIKLFQGVTKPQYLVIDSDVYINKPLQIIGKNGKPNFFIGDEQNHLPYYVFTQEMFGFGREYNHSFINEIMYFDRFFIKSMLHTKKCIYSKEGFVRKSIEIINKINHPSSSFSEYETYGNYVTRYKRTYYNYISIRTKSIHQKREFTDYEIMQIIEKYKNSNIHKLSIHSWM